VTDLPTVENEPVGNMRPICLWNDFQELRFGFCRCGRVHEPESVRNAKNVGVNGNGTLVIGGCQNHICGFAADAGKCEQLLHRVRHAPMKALDKRAGSASDVFCFDAEESATSNIPFERSQRRLRHGLRRRKRFEKRGRHHVDARIGALR